MFAPGVEASGDVLDAPLSGGGRRSSREQSTGTMVTATKSDMSSENITTTDSWTKSTLETPVRKSSGTNTAMCVRIDARIADQTSSLPSMRGLHAGLALFHVSEGVLEDDDRGVDDHADTERQASERHRVQREAREVEQGERADDRDRNRQGRR